MSEPVIIKLVRHGLSDANTGKVNPTKVGDHRIGLDKIGKKQAFERGEQIGADFILDALRFRSPFKRTRQTSKHMCKGARLHPDDVLFMEDPRLREIDTGYKDYEKQRKKRAKYGWFFYRFAGGESAADCYDRVCTFLESMARQSERKKNNKALIISHGLLIRVFVMRFLHLSVEQFEMMENPGNCDVITIAHKEQLKNPQFVSGKWGVEGLRLRKPVEKSKKKTRKNKR